MRIGDELTVLPQEICPVDGVVLDGHAIMNEA
jgi:cation transport ATPase